MFKLTIPEVGDKKLFEAALEPVSSTVDKLSAIRDIGEGEINTAFGKKNKIAVGEPYYENLVSRLNEKRQEIPHEIKKMMDNYDFHFVSLSCSFLPDHGCKFKWAKFGIDLTAIAKDSGALLEEKPIAYDMFPDEVLSEIAYKRVSNFGPELKFNLGVVNAGINAIDFRTQKELIIYEPQIFGFGVRMPSVSWNFKSTEQKEILGNKKNLLLIIRTPKNSKVTGRFLLGAEVEFKIGEWIPIPLIKRKDKIVDAEYDLSK